MRALASPFIAAAIVTKADPDEMKAIGTGLVNMTQTPWGQGELAGNLALLLTGPKFVKLPFAAPGESSFIGLPPATRLPALETSPVNLVAGPDGVLMSVRDRVLANVGASRLARQGSGFAVASRRWTATDFYESAGWADWRIQQHLGGIDFNFPVSVGVIPQGTILAQYGFPGDPVGNYFANIGTPAKGLGIYPRGRKMSLYEATTDLSVLRSTASDTVDSWSVPSWNLDVPGGNQQIFVPQNKLMLPFQ